MFPHLWFPLLGGSFVFLDEGPSILFLVFPLHLGALVYFGLAGFIYFSNSYHDQLANQVLLIFVMIICLDQSLLINCQTKCVAFGSFDLLLSESMFNWQSEFFSLFSCFYFFCVRILLVWFGNSANRPKSNHQGFLLSSQGGPQLGFELPTASDQGSSLGQKLGVQIPTASFVAKPSATRVAHRFFFLCLSTLISIAESVLFQLPN